MVLGLDDVRFDGWRAGLHRVVGGLDAVVVLVVTVVVFGFSSPRSRRQPGRARVQSGEMLGLVRRTPSAEAVVRDLENRGGGFEDRT